MGKFQDNPSLSKQPQLEAINQPLLGLHLRKFKNQIQKPSSKYFIVINEVPFLLLFIILILTIKKSFH